jgi:hypothetical protein
MKYVAFFFVFGSLAVAIGTALIGTAITAPWWVTAWLILFVAALAYLAIRYRVLAP